MCACSSRIIHETIPEHDMSTKGGEAAGRFIVVCDLPVFVSALLNIGVLPVFVSAWTADWKKIKTPLNVIVKSLLVLKQ